jgi:hypothetical protein
MATNAEVVTALETLYPVFADIDGAQLLALVAAARAMVPQCSLPDTTSATQTYSVRTLALVYKTASLASSSPDLASTLAAGSVKRMKDGDVEVEYQATGSSGASASSGYANFEQLYQMLIRPYARNSPRVLGYTG